MAKKAHCANPPARPAKAEGWKGKLAGAWGRFGHALESVAARLPWKRPSLWLAGFFHPEETYDKEMGRATLGELFGNLLVFYFIYSAVFFAVLVAVTSVSPQADAGFMGFQTPENLLWTGIAILVANTSVSALGALVVFALVHVGARALGGCGGFVKQSYAISLVLCGVNSVLLLFAVAGAILLLPTYLIKGVLLLDIIFVLASLVVGIPLLLLCLAIICYSVYAYFVMVKRAHGLSSWRAAGAIAIGAALAWLINAAFETLAGMM